MFKLTRPLTTSWNHCNSRIYTTGLDFYLYRHCPLTMVWSSWSYWFCFFFSALQRHWYFSPVKRNRKACRLAGFPPNLNQRGHFLRKFIAVEKTETSWSFCLKLNFSCSQASNHFCSCIAKSKLGLASRWCSNVRSRATSFFSLGVSKSD